MFSVGEKLKRARLDKGLEISAVAARTRISRSYLEAIELDDRKKLPSGFFYKSFVDQYAQALSLDTTEIDAAIDRMLAEDAPLPLPGQDGNPIHRDPPIIIRSRFRKTRAVASFAMLILVMLGCAEIYGWWHTGRLPVDLSWLQEFNRSTPLLEALKQAQPANPAGLMVPAQAAPQRLLQAGASSPAARLTETGASDSATSDDGSTIRSGDPRVLLDLIAREKTWLSASSDGRPVFSGMLLAHESKTIAGKQSARLRIGNAAGLEVRLNGKPLGPLGARGQVLVVLFTPDNFEIVAPTKEGD